jgi:Uma2 family endonuclease
MLELLTPTDSKGLLVPRLSADVPTVPIYRLSVEQYHRMAEVGILLDGDPLELLEGWLVPKMTKNPPHESTIRRLHRHLMQLLSKVWVIHLQSPIELGESEPEPDLSIVRFAPDEYGNRHPTAEAVGLVIEVAHTTLAIDRGIKHRIYAKAGIAEYWIANLMDDIIEVYTKPNGSDGVASYSRRQDYASGQAVPLVLAGQALGEVAVSDVLS